MLLGGVFVWFSRPQRMIFKKAIELFQRRRNQKLLFQSVFYTRMGVLVFSLENLGLVVDLVDLIRLHEEMTPVTDNTANVRLGVEKANKNTRRLGRTYTTRRAFPFCEGKCHSYLTVSVSNRGCNRVTQTNRG